MSPPRATPDRQLWRGRLDRLGLTRGPARRVKGDQREPCCRSEVQDRLRPMAGCDLEHAADGQYGGDEDVPTIFPAVEQWLSPTHDSSVLLHLPRANGLRPGTDRQIWRAPSRRYHLSRGAHCVPLLRPSVQVSPSRSSRHFTREQRDGDRALQTLHAADSSDDSHVQTDASAERASGRRSGSGSRATFGSSARPLWRYCSRRSRQRTVVAPIGSYGVAQSPMNQT